MLTQNLKREIITSEVIMRILIFILFLSMFASCSLISKRRVSRKPAIVMKFPKYIEISGMIESCANKLIDKQVKATDAFEVCNDTYRFGGER